MARLLDVALDDQSPIAKAAARHADRGSNRLVQATEISHHVHALAATTRAGLEQGRQANRAHHGHHGFQLVAGVATTGHHGNPGLVHQGLGPRLVAQRRDGFRPRADEHQAGLGHRLGERAVFGQKAIARMHRVAVRFQRRGDHAGAIQIT